MATIGFFTPVTFNNLPKSPSQSLLENIDSYFPQFGKKAYVVQGEVLDDHEGVVLLDGTSSSWAVTALKVASYFTIVIPIILLIAKAVLRSIHHFHLIDTRQKLEEGISNDTIQSASRVIDQQNLNGEEREDTDQIQWINSKVFTLTAFPDLIFKICADSSRFRNMIESQNVCLAYQLDCLIVPHAQFFQVRDRLFIAENRLNIQDNESAQEDLYRLPGLDETIRQLAIFIALTGFSDVSWQKIPLIDTGTDLTENRQVALIDLEEMNGARTGFFGASRPAPRLGLVHCLHSVEHIDIALTEARRYNIRGNYAEIKAQRLRKIAEDQRLREFHERTGCFNDPRKPILVEDLDSLELNLEEEAEMTIFTATQDPTSPDGIAIRREIQKITLREVTIDLIRFINEALQQTPEEASVKRKRYVLLNKNEDLMQRYESLHYLSPGVYDLEDAQRKWPHLILTALIAKGHLFKMDTPDGYGFCVDARAFYIQA